MSGMQFRSCLLAALLGLAGCRQSSRPPTDAGAELDGGTAAACQAWGSPTQVGTFTVQPTLSEVSGLAQSARDPDLLWVHNDSGDAAHLYALSRDGTLRAVFGLAGVSARDWEDMARGPCPPGLGTGTAGESCLFLGDIGDNRAAYPSLLLHVLPEPQVTPQMDPATPITIAPTASITLTYEDGARDSEGLLIDPTGRPWIVSKGREGPPAVYQVEGTLTAAASLTLRRVFTFAADDLDPSSPLVTAADLDAPGRRLLLRTYDSLLELTLEGDLSAQSLGSARIRKVPAAIEPQGEAVAWEPGGQAYLTASEQIGVLSRVACTD